MSDFLAQTCRLLAGPRPPTYDLTRWVFLRLLGMVYLVAFWSLGVQIVGLVGRQGILPIEPQLGRIYEVHGAAAYWDYPTLCWFNAGDAMLQILCWGGVGLSLLLIVGIAPLPVAALLWLLYLSLSVAGQTFLNFQWDALLLETGLLAIFYAPLQLLPWPTRERRPSPLVRWLLWLLLFKLIFLSGITKIASGDPTWADWTALFYHYETQPIPTWTSWYFHHLPAWVHKQSTAAMYFMEIAVPFFIFVPPRLWIVRRTACGLLVLLQLMIAASGNYGFFNLLSIVLCFTLLDDGVWRRVLPRRLTDRLGGPTAQPESMPRTVVAATLVVLILPLSTLSIVREIQRTRPVPPGVARNERLPWPDRVLGWVAPLRSVNGYGLFRVMTTERPEIVIEGSRDGVIWEAYSFRWKPGEVNRPPRFAGPHMPRLDWQMWFAALNPRGAEHWLMPLAEDLLRGTPEVLALLDENPFAGDPPRYVRFVLYQHHFTTPAEKRATGAWWKREKLGDLTQPLTLR